MIYVLAFLFSWLSGLLVILITAFYSYDQFSIVDITSFAVFTFAAFLILFLLIYLIVLRTIAKQVRGKQQFIYFPLLFSLFANLPAYVVIWINTPALYSGVEATLFTIGMLTSGLVFGLFRAWQNNISGAGYKYKP